MKSGLFVEHITVEYDDQIALRNVSFTLERGGCLALLGESGSGKSTLLRAIAGLQETTTGHISWNGRNLDRVSPRDREIGMMFQDGALFPHKSVEGNVEFALAAKRIKKHIRHDRVNELLALVRLTGYNTRAIDTLSGGERQRVAFARALAASPEVLLLDEPFGALDRLLRIELARQLQSALAQSGTTAILVTHDHEEAFSLGEAVGILHEGSLLQLGPTAQVLASPNSPKVAEFLGYSPPIDVVCNGKTVEFPWGSFANVANWPQGQLRVVIPPVAAQLDGTIPGIVESRAFRGWQTIVNVRLDDGSIVAATSSDVPRVGASVSIRIELEACKAFSQDA